MSAPRFVIQKHAARHLHYDFRLEVAGVYKSWAIPKGPSVNPRDRRLAVAVEDHALSWGDFEGVIAEGSYGAGTVIVWDAGTYQNLTEAEGEVIPMEEALARGRAVFRLEGAKLRGSYALRRIKPAEGQWLLTKLPDEEAQDNPDFLAQHPESVLSRLTIEQMASRKAR